MRVYLAGPMRGKPGCNFSLFREVREKLRLQGHMVYCPAALAEAVGVVPDKDDNPNTHEGRIHLRYAAQVDLSCLYAVDAIALLPEWETSRGATMEVAVAQFLGLPIYDALTMEHLTVPTKPWEFHGYKPY